VLSSTPGQPQPTLKTPVGRSGAQASLRTPAPRPRKPVTGGGDTRLSPLSALTSTPTLPETRASPMHVAPEAPVVSEVDVPVVTDEAELPPKSRAPLVVLLLALVALIGAAGVFVLAPALSGNSPQVTVVKSGDDLAPAVKPPARGVPRLADPAAVTPNEPVSGTPSDLVAVRPSEPSAVKPDEPAGVKPADPAAVKPNEPVAVKTNEPVAVKPNEPVAVKPNEPVAVKKGISTAQLEGRLAKLEQKLEAREAQTGEKDKVLRQIFEQARKEIAAAATDAQRREAWATLNDIATQFPK
jgi:hypothetical protein